MTSTSLRPYHDICAALPMPCEQLRVGLAGPAISDQATAIVVPAMNEAGRLAGCLSALAEGVEPIFIVVIANDCTDDTTEVARGTAEAAGLRLAVLEVDFRGRGNAGAARHLGMSAACALNPQVARLLTTDADCTVCPGWTDNSVAHLSRADAVCGHVIAHPQEVSRLPGHCVARRAAERAYGLLTREFESLLGPDVLNPWPHHGQAPGASLGFTRAGYEAIGGFANIDCGEDRDIIQRLRWAGRPVVYAGDVSVVASCRLTGRARGGMADTISRYIADPESLADESLMPARALMKRADRALRAGRRFRLISPVPRSLRLGPAQLAEETALLEGVNATLRATAPKARSAVLSRLIGDDASDWRQPSGLQPAQYAAE